MSFGRVPRGLSPFFPALMNTIVSDMSVEITPQKNQEIEFTRDPSWKRQMSMPRIWRTRKRLEECNLEESHEDAIEKSA